jgi:hypothetical protein
MGIEDPWNWLRIMSSGGFWIIGVEHPDSIIRISSTWAYLYNFVLPFYLSVISAFCMVGV